MQISGKKSDSCKGFNDLETAQFAFQTKTCEIFSPEIKTSNEGHADQAGVSALASGDNVVDNTDLDEDYRNKVSETVLTERISDEIEGHNKEYGNQEPPFNEISETTDSPIRSEFDYIWSKISNIESIFNSNYLTKRLNDVENENTALKKENTALRSDLNNALNKNMQIQEDNKSLNKVMKDIPTSNSLEDKDKITYEEDEDGFIKVSRKMKSGNITNYPVAQESSELRNG